MADLRKYGTGAGADVWIPMIKRGVVDQAVSADWTPAAGDVKVSKDGGAAANIATLPTAVAMGNGAIWRFQFSDAELQCKVLTVNVADSATKAVEDQNFTIETYGHASAMYVTDFAALADATGKVLLQATQTGVTIPTVTNLTNAPGDSSGTTTLLTRLTSGRAGNLDNLDATVSSRSTLTAAQVWDYLVSAATTVGSMGKRIVDYLTGDAFARLGAPAGTSVSADIAVASTRVTTALPNAAPAAAGGLLTRGTGAGQIESSGGVVNANLTSADNGVITPEVLASDALTGQTVAAVTNPVSVGGYEVDQSPAEQILGLPPGGDRVLNVDEDGAVRIGSVSDNAIGGPGIAASAVTKLQNGLATATNVSDAQTSILAKILKYFRLGYRKDSAVATDHATELGEINANTGTGTGAYANSTDGLEALRDRGDAAWVTGSTPPTAATIADAVWDEALTGHTTAGTAGRALQLARADAGGKWVISGDTLTLYDVDNTTALKTFALAPSGGPYTSRTATPE